MRKILIILVMVNGLVNFTLGQTFIPVTIPQPPALTATAGHDTIACTGHAVALGGNPTATGGNNNYVYMWSPPDGLNNPTSPNPLATLSESKSYMLSVTDGHGCVAVSFISIFIDPCTGIDEKNLNAVLTVFPNPSDGVFTIQGISAFSGQLQRIDVINQLGQVVFDRSYDYRNAGWNLEIDTGIREPGIYFLKVSFSDRIVSQRVIVR